VFKYARQQIIAHICHICSSAHTQVTDHNCVYYDLTIYL